MPVYPGIARPSEEPAALVRSLDGIKEGLEIGQRVRGDMLDSWARLRELRDAGVIRIIDGQIFPGNGLVTTPGGTGGGGGSFTPTKVERGAAFVGMVGALTTAVNKVSFTVPYAATIEGVRILTEGGPGSIVVDIWKDTYANFPPVVGDSIVAASKPTIVADTKYEDTTLTGWVTAIAAGDVLRFSIDSVSIFTYAAVLLKLQPV